MARAEHVVDVLVTDKSHDAGEKVESVMRRVAEMMVWRGGGSEKGEGASAGCNNGTGRLAGLASSFVDTGLAELILSAWAYADGWRGWFASVDTRCEGLENFRLRVFRAVAEQMSFRKAAEVLHLSQPAVSQHIRALEEETGVRLFDRARGEGHGSQISLTEAGRVLLGYARSRGTDDGGGSASAGGVERRSGWGVEAGGFDDGGAVCSAADSRSVFAAVSAGEVVAGERQYGADCRGRGGREG